MRTRVATLPLAFTAALLVSVPANAQYGSGTYGRATGETYHVEIGGFLWNPSPDIVISSEGFGLIGSDIDLVEDLQIDQVWQRQLRVVLRPGLKHKFRFEYTPIKYENPEAVLRRDLVFNGIRFPIAVPVEAEMTWRAFRFGYEWDFLSRDRGFAGLLLDVKYTDVQASLTNRTDSEFVRARAPIPAIGFIGRGYVLPNVAITGEFSFFKVPSDIDDDYGGKYFDLDIYGTVNFTDNFGAQGGYRSFDVFYKIEEDEGNLQLKGFYFGGLVRF
ncbi:MAG TPA: hypothetical protein VD833_02290 [Vicinamibacterales bacterium]|nr:hypothetical protein [Vicinamibacterales bacterium]